MSTNNQKIETALSTEQGLEEANFKRLEDIGGYNTFASIEHIKDRVGVPSAAETTKEFVDVVKSEKSKAPLSLRLFVVTTFPEEFNWHDLDGTEDIQKSETDYNAVVTKPRNSGRIEIDSENRTMNFDQVWKMAAHKVEKIPRAPKNTTEDKSDLAVEEIFRHYERMEKIAPLSNEEVTLLASLLQDQLAHRDQIQKRYSDEINNDQDITPNMRMVLLREGFDQELNKYQLDQDLVSSERSRLIGIAELVQKSNKTLLERMYVFGEKLRQSEYNETDPRIILGTRLAIGLLTLAVVIYGEKSNLPLSHEASLFLALIYGLSFSVNSETMLHPTALVGKSFSKLAEVLNGNEILGKGISTPNQDNDSVDTDISGANNTTTNPEQSKLGGSVIEKPAATDDRIEGSGVVIPNWKQVIDHLKNDDSTK